MERNETIEAFYRKNFKQLVSITTNRVPNKSRHLAEECVQEAFCNALKYWQAYNPERGKFVTWFHRILQNCINRCIRDEGGGNNASIDDDEEDLTPFMIGEDIQVPKRIVMRIEEAIAAEPQPKQDILVMFFKLGMQTKDIEAVTNVNDAAIRKMISRWRINWDEENIFSHK